ncbi:EVE domain-containing protein [uncultured Paracoccus sp.]|uniref:EVE domain-containing protein n=1 Tax=uncultured Paracoccus sp. TaxID=189685 RepID=UPI00261027C2|nr:EVE domain-containing protein [uncultured Paracoccus sp.]
MTRHWISVVSREHVLIGVAGGFAMMNHGKLAPLKRLSPGDSLTYYSPKTAYPEGEPLKAFTATGTVGAAPPYGAEMPGGWTGYRIDIDWMTARETPIVNLTDRLEFTKGNWGMLARRGLFEISDADFRTIRAAMTGD